MLTKKPEHRRSPRFPCRGPAGATIFTDKAGYEADTHDVSDLGMGLISRAPIGFGMTIAIKPQDGSLRAGMIHAVVKHATALPDGTWLIGCRLTQSVQHGVSWKSRF